MFFSSTAYTSHAEPERHSNTGSAFCTHQCIVKIKYVSASTQHHLRFSNDSCEKQDKHVYVYIFVYILYTDG